MRGVRTCGADGCNAKGVLDFYKNNYAAFTAAQTRAQSLYGTSIDYYGTLFETYDVTGNDMISGHDKFTISSFGRKAGTTNTYTYNFQEVGSPHGDGTYTLSWNMALAEPGGGDWQFIGPFAANATINSVTLSGTGSNYFMTLFLRKNGTNAEFYLRPVGGTPTGFYPGMSATIYYSQGGVNYVSNPVSLGNVIVRNEKVFIRFERVDQQITIANNGSFTCGSTTYSNQTPANLLIYLKNCFDANVANHEFFKFFSAGAGDVQFRAMPNGDKQYSTRVANIRDELYDKDVGPSWYEYVLPNLLSKTDSMRFSVDLRRERDTATGRYRTLSFEIINEWTSSASGGFVRAPLAPARAADAEIDSTLTQCANLQGAPLICQP
jgi:hypothetical protein